MAAFTFTSCDTQYLTPEGGTRIQLFGTWPLNTSILAYIGSGGSTADLLCYSAVPQQGFVLYALNTTTVVAFSPLLVPTLTAANLFISCGGSTQLASSAFIVTPNEYFSSVYSLRALLPPTWAVGPRSILQETAAL
jgi:hypothetical protein